MKNNRSLSIAYDFLTKHELSTASPPLDSLFWKLWNASIAIAHQALNTPFIQGIKSGTLNPTAYGSFNISDAYYCFNGAQDYLVAESKASNPTLKAFLTKKYNGYLNYNNTFPKVWHIKDATGIVPSDICKQYAEFESNIASHKDPIYALIVMIPCEYLWAWLAEQLAPNTTPGNLYTPWITENNDPKSAYAMGNFLVEYQKENHIDETLAMELFKQAMRYEYQNFNAAICN